MKGRFCPRCGGEIPDMEQIAATAAQIPVNPAFAAAEDVQEKRLAVCRLCEALREGVLCAYCGCFTAFRVRPAKSYCPHPAGNKWKNSG